jgi:hypothetical protein
MANVLDFGINGQFPVKVGGTGASTAKYFPRLYGSSANPILGQTPATPSSSSPAGMLALPPQNVFNSQQFDVLATGSFGSDTGDPSGTVLIALYAVTGTAAAPVYTALASTGAVTPLVQKYSWAIRAHLYGGNTSGVLGGSYEAYVQGALANSSPKTSDAVISGLDFLNGNAALGGNISMAGGNPVCGFVVGVTFGTSDATNTASMSEFTIES